MKTTTQTIYLLFSCDEWKSTSSMSLIMATIDRTKIIEQVKREIAKKHMIYDCCEDEDNPTQKEIKDMKEGVMRSMLPDMGDRLNDLLKYGHIKTVVDGEVQ